ncbi:NAD-dependent epimerase/dehydratase family protein [Hoeflea prorocentri]|uniref:NAD(P)-dependent oxidoreductase n=1 Tax=Hoeflea prorocentri TaxID=1922333 RepID=A0A9X3UHS9_9HYPH|nr:NAD(P)-dependent oxidoreductase [Hoeflea prorocentri]MCY6381070.1 NAD(P)-dependent oxidoreductase [Hoeflea prorocentri]MDA5398870.1 NAD(P)-dependent oxidoreductase [Hoeflea prorocentri]
MIIFVTGATGVLGRPTVQRLVQNGHQVRALSRSEANRHIIMEDGAIPMAADLFDPLSVTSALHDCEAVLHLATRIPPVSSMKNPGAWDENDRIRREGTHCLIRAAERTSSVRTFVYPSVSIFYGDAGPQWVSAEDAAIEPLEIHRSTIDAENAVLGFSKTGPHNKGVVLRFGNFYGPTSPDSAQTIAMARKGFAISVAPSPAYKSMIWIDDAASAIVEAAESAPTGLYDVVEDDPATQFEAIAAIATAVRRRRLLKLPRVLLRIAIPKNLRDLLTRSQRISNTRFRDVTGWRPQVPSQRIGWQMMAQKDKSTDETPSLHGTSKHPA